MAFDIRDHLDGVAVLLGGHANVIMQLSRPGVGYGVLESTVDSGKVTLHPIKRLRTTVTYLAVALLGTDEERRAYREAVNGSHRAVRSTADSPVRYNAFEPGLQLWVAACLYWGTRDLIIRLHGRLDEDTEDALYRYCARLGTTLQVREQDWPADRAAFAEYWDAGVRAAHLDEPVRRYLDRLTDLRQLPTPLAAPARRAHRFISTGMLPEPFRAQMRLDWSPRQQRRHDRMIRVVAALNRVQPGPLRRFPFNVYLWDMRRRMRTGRPLV